MTLYWFNPSTGDWQVWNAAKYDQENPQITPKTGEYAFMVPKGSYYLQVEKEGYQENITQEFNAKDQIVNKNIQIIPIPKPFWRKWLTLKNILIGGLVLLVIILIAVIFKLLTASPLTERKSM